MFNFTQVQRNMGKNVSMSSQFDMAEKTQSV